MDSRAASSSPLPRKKRKTMVRDSTPNTKALASLTGDTQTVQQPECSSASSQRQTQVTTVLNVVRPDCFHAALYIPYFFLFVGPFDR